MLLSEFELLTDFHPDCMLYEAIERAYNEQTPDGKDVWKDKQSFCIAYKLNEGGLADRIQRCANAAIWKKDEAYRKSQTENSALVQKLQAEVEHLKKELDTELEWRPAENIGTNLDQAAYEELSNFPCSKALTDDEAKDKLSSFFGFEHGKIEIIHTVETFERNRHGKIRVADTYSRQPVYGASDFNYIRFNCACLQWEMIDGELEAYED